MGKKFFLKNIYNKDLKKSGCILFTLIGIVLISISCIGLNYFNNGDIYYIDRAIYTIMFSELFVSGCISIYITLNKKIKVPIGIVIFLAIIFSNKLMNIVILSILALLIYIIVVCIDRLFVTIFTCCIYSTFWYIFGIFIINSNPGIDLYYVLYMCITLFLTTYVIIGKYINVYILNKVYKVVMYDQEVLTNHMYILYFIVFVYINLSPYRFTNGATIINNSFVTLIAMLSINKKGILNQKLEAIISKKDKENHYM